jgi:hypothetical protein
MPVHDWTRVEAGMFHDFHNAWITELRNALNGGLLPPDYYALGEQHAGHFVGDILGKWGQVLTYNLRSNGEPTGVRIPRSASGVVASVALLSHAVGRV